MQPFRTLTMIFTLALCPITGLFAQDNGTFDDFGDLDLEALLDAPVQSASGRSESISNAPAVIEVVHRSQFQAWGVSTLYDVLERVVGVEMIESHWGRTTVNMRGIQPQLFNDKVLLLIDDHPLYEVGNMSFFLEQIPITMVDRVEIIRGPGGVLFGTNAYAGVIHVITVEPEQSEGLLGLAAGAMLPDESGAVYDRQNYDGRAAGTWHWGSGGMSLHVQALRTPIWRADVPAARRSDFALDVLEPHTFPRGETSVSIGGKVHQQWNDNQFRLLGLLHHQTKHKWGINPRSEAQSLPNEALSGSLVGYWSRQFDRVSLKTRLGYDRDTQTNHSGIFPVLAAIRPGDPLDVEVDSTKIEAGLTLDGDILDNLISWSSGVQSSIYKFDHYRMIFANARELAPGVPVLDNSELSYETNLFAQSVYRPVNALSLLAGVRLNLFNGGQLRPDLPDPDAKLTVNPRAGLIYRAHETTTLKLLYGRAFRVPSLFSMFVEAQGLLSGDPDLKPETIDTVELAIDTRPRKGWSLRVNGYVNISQDDIVFELQPTGGDKYVNANGKIIRGVELTSRYLWSEHIDAQVGIGFQEGHERGSNRYMNEIARLLITTSLTGMAFDKSLRLTPMLRYVGPRDNLGGATVWHVTAYYDPLNWLTVGIIAKNIFDKRFADIEPVQRDTPSGVIQNQPRTLSAYLEARF